MMGSKERILRQEIIKSGRKLYDLRLVVATSGNLSARIDEHNILITATGTSLGNLKTDDILKVDLRKEVDEKKEHVTSEFPLHSLIYKDLPAQVVIHCHPSLVNAYFSVYSDLKALTFESKLYLGNIPVVTQDTPAVVKPELVVDALKTNNLVVLKNHGVACIGDRFNDALYLIEALEEAVKVAAVARLFKKDILDDLDKGIQGTLVSDAAYTMFSQEHIQAIVDLVNTDEFIGRKGEELDLTLQLAIKMDGIERVYPHTFRENHGCKPSHQRFWCEGKAMGESGCPTGEARNKQSYTCKGVGVYKFNFEKGKITKLDSDDNAAFVISAPSDVWEMVFLGKIDPFVATMQGKMKLKGEMGKLSRWYVPFSRLFELFKQVKIKV